MREHTVLSICFGHVPAMTPVNSTYERFKDQLMTGAIEPGQMVTLRELGDLLGSTIGQLRGVVKRLEAENLVRVFPQRGIQIIDVNVDLIKNSFELRLFLERGAVRRFATTAPQRRLDHHHNAFSQILQKTKQGPATAGLLKRASTADFDFHRDIIDSLNNPIIADVHRTTMDKIQLIRLKNKMTEALIIRVTTEHLLVTAALQRRDAEGAVAALETHLSLVQARCMGIEFFLDELQPATTE